jgi:hypothetical protein
VKSEHDACEFRALRDTVDLSGNTIPLIFLDVLYNDEICDGYTSFRITDPPHYGTAYVSQEHQTIAYERDLLQNKNDSLQYQICNAQECSSAIVYIKRVK